MNTRMKRLKAIEQRMGAYAERDGVCVVVPAGASPDEIEERKRCAGWIDQRPSERMRRQNQIITVHGFFESGLDRYEE